jgi:nucleoid-associated protein YgaU
MQRDFKIGMVVGLVLVVIVALWLSTRPSLSTKARMLRSYKSGPTQESSVEQTRFVTNLPNSPSLEAKTEIEGERLSTPEVTVIRDLEETETQRFHIVRRGETLSDISQRYYGQANKWQRILDANRNVIESANKLKPGVKLIIPE